MQQQLQMLQIIKIVFQMQSFCWQQWN